MKVLKIIFGCLGALWALGCFSEMVNKLISGAGGPYIASQLLGGLVGILLGTAICIGCFKSAFKKPDQNV